MPLPFPLPFEVDVTVTEAGWHEVVGDETDFTARALQAALGVLDAPRTQALAGRELSIALVSDQEIAALNASYRGKEGPTNVLSFPATGPASGPAPVQGDVVMALQQTLRECHASGRAPRDHATHLLVHGFLHLQGYDHMTNTEAKVMEDLERRALGTLGLSDPYVIAS